MSQTMPDRAVVDKRASVLLGMALEISERYGEPMGTGSYVRKDMQEVSRYIRAAMQTEPQPRALVALSDDRQWLVVPNPIADKEWLFFELRTSYNPYIDNTRIWYEGTAHWDDTGQDAQEVLAAWLEGRGG